MMEYIEQLLGEQGQRILQVKTSGLPEFERNRAFYDKCNYIREAVIRDFIKQERIRLFFGRS